MLSRVADVEGLAKSFVSTEGPEADGGTKLARVVTGYLVKLVYNIAEIFGFVKLFCLSHQL